MTKPKVTYFDLAGSRGEEVRLALVIAGVAFEDNRIARSDLAALKPKLPFGSLPTLEIEGRGVFAQTNAILRLIGRMHGLYPEDPFEAARCDALMDACEDLRQRISPSMRMEDPEEKAAARRRLATEDLPQWARGVERLIGDGPFAGGERPNVADIKLFMLDRWIASGGLDGIPTDTLDPFSKLKDATAALRDLPAVRDRYADAT